MSTNHPTNASNNLIDVACPTCGEPTRVARSLLGRQIRCGRCQATFIASWDDPAKAAGNGDIAACGMCGCQMPRSKLLIHDGHFLCSKCAPKLLEDPEGQKVTSILVGGVIVALVAFAGIFVLMQRKSGPSQASTPQTQPAQTQPTQTRPTQTTVSTVVRQATPAQPPAPEVLNQDPATAVVEACVVQDRKQADAGQRPTVFPSGTTRLTFLVKLKQRPEVPMNIDFAIESNGSQVPMSGGAMVTEENKATGEFIIETSRSTETGRFPDGAYQAKVQINDTTVSLLNWQVGDGQPTEVAAAPEMPSAPAHVAKKAPARKPAARKGKAPARPQPQVTPPVAVQPEPEPMPEVAAPVAPQKKAEWPHFAFMLPKGTNEVRIVNPGNVDVRVGLRRGRQGRDMTVGAGKTASMFVTDGDCDVYFRYADQPEVMYKGDSFSVAGQWIEIRLVQVQDGNYKLHRMN